MVVHQLEINATGLGITANVSANLGNKVAKILAWNQETFQDEAKAIDLSFLINGVNEVEITTISASDLGVSKITGIWIIEFISDKATNPGRVPAFIIEPSALGIVADLVAYHECVLDKALSMSISNCGASSKKGCTKLENLLLLSTLLESLGDAILFGLFPEAVQIAKNIEELCEICASCPDYNIEVSRGDFGYKTIEGQILKT